ncbi:MAG: cation transporting ATPase C-terminal domain-containing protein, partial [Candidatus Methanoperedens sp.]|nr:cation transporting ATPase C-terminal domain-containing protein [Candidatus Methanoperedens sp.]
AEVAVIFVAFVIMGFPLPLIALQILYVNLVTEEFPALGLSLEPGSRDIMSRKPRDPQEQILSKRILFYTLAIASIFFIGTFSLFAWTLEKSQNLQLAQTTAFATLITCGLFNALNCRSLEESVFRTGFFTNKRLLLALSGSIIAMMLAIYWQPMQAVLKTAPLGFEAWIRILLVSSTVVVAAEIMKKFVRLR